MIITNTIEILFHFADMAVLAVFVDGPAVAAVGACGSLILLLISLFTSFAAGANILISKRIGAGDEPGTNRAVGTSLIIGGLSGIFLAVFAGIFARKFLILMNCQPDVLDMAVRYLRIYFLGMPVLMLYNFVAAALRAAGDSTSPMIYMIMGGCINIVVNIFFVVVFHMTVEGVAIGTVLSTAVTLICAFIRLLGKKGLFKLERSDLRIGRTELLEIVRVGVPTCFCGLFFYAANVILASSVNSMSTDAMTANAIAEQFDGIIYTVGAAIAYAASIIVSQNFGAQNFDRIRKTIVISIAYAAAVSLTLGAIFVMLAEPMLHLLSDSPSVIAIAKDRMTLLCLTYFITSIMEVFAFSLRALQRQTSTMVVGGICGFGIRVFWAKFIWPLCPTLSMLFASYAVSAFAAIVIYIFVYRDAMKKFTA